MVKGSIVRCLINAAAGFACAAAILSCSLKGNSVNSPLLEEINSHDHAVHIKGGRMRDPYIVLGPDGMYYLTGTVSGEISPDEPGYEDPELGRDRPEGKNLRIWRSPDLVEWKYIGSPYNTLDIPMEIDYSMPNASLFWAPEIHWTGDRWVLVHCPAGASTLALTEGGSLKGPWIFPDVKAFYMKHDPSLFRDDDGKWYMTHGNGGVLALKDGFKGIAERFRIDPADRQIGHEGTTILKIGGKYVFFGTGWSTDIMRKGSYNLYYCTADDIRGPYSERRFVGRFLGHGTPFKDKDGRWWCTAFYNADVPVLPADGIENVDLSETAQTINKMGTTIVPLEVKILPDGDVYIRATDPHYAVPGPDEVTEPGADFRLKEKKTKK